ncbi:MAG TPA: cyclic nucleotide-binding domain-containing protein [Armatimonadota bacterium]|jgi:CRP-like cAMP-binding protein
MESTDPLSPKSLARIPLFEEFSQTELLDLRPALELQRKRRESAIMREEAMGLRDFYIVLEGTVRILEHDLQVGTRGPNDVVGELAFVAKRRRTASVVAETDCVLIRVDEATVRASLTKNPMVGWKLMAAIARLISDKFVESDQRCRELLASK